MSAVTGLTSGNDYSALNGIAGSYGNYCNSYSYSMPSYYGGYSYLGNIDLDKAKENLQNTYDLNTLQQSYNNRQSTQMLDWSQLCTNIATLLRQGRTDDALEEYKKLTSSMASAQQYESYDESQIKALAQKMYAQTIGVGLVDDIDANVSSSFVQGLKSGIPIIGTFFAQGNSKDDAISEVTGVSQSNATTAAKAIGSVTAGIGTGAAAGAALGLCGGPFAPLTSTAGAIGGAIVGGVMSIGKLIFS